MRIMVCAVLLMHSFTIWAGEPENPRFKVCFTSKGMDPAVSLSTAKEIVKVLESLDAVVVVPHKGIVITSACCESANCLRSVAVEHLVVGVVNVRFLQFGPMARVNVMTYDAQTGKKLHDAKVNLKVEDLPAVEKLKKQLKASIEPLRKIEPIPRVEKVKTQPVLPEHGYLVADTQPWSEVYVDGGFVGKTPITSENQVELNPGMHKVVFKTEDGSSHEYEVTIKKGRVAKLIKDLRVLSDDTSVTDRQDVDDVPEPPELPVTETPPTKPEIVERKKDWPAPIGALPITLWSTGGAGIVTGIVFGYLAKEHEDNANNPNFVGGQLEIENAENDALIANIAFGVGAACIVTGLLVWLLDEEKTHERTSLVPISTPGGAGIGLIIKY